MVTCPSSTPDVAVREHFSGLFFQKEFVFSGARIAERVVHYDFWALSLEIFYPMNKNVCPQCGGAKKPWFELCWNCSETQNQLPKCEVCGEPVQEGHTLCRTHWAEKQNSKKHIKNIDNLKERKETEFKEKFEGKFYFNSQRVRSKSELIICYFLEANGVNFRYEHAMDVDGKELRPDFVIVDQKGSTIILEHYGMVGSPEYDDKRKAKDDIYKKLCLTEPGFFYVCTDEDDIYNLKDKLGRKLNSTPIKKVLWK